jgi:hypothetical protein
MSKKALQTGAAVALIAAVSGAEKEMDEETNRLGSLVSEAIPEGSNRGWTGAV